MRRVEDRPPGRTYPSEHENNVSHSDNTTFATRILDWYQIHGRKTLPWQQDKTPTGSGSPRSCCNRPRSPPSSPTIERFMARFPDVLALADAPIDEVLHHWTGLGYYARPATCTRRPSRSAIGTAACFRNGLEEVMALPGIGRSTAGPCSPLSWSAPRHPGRQREAVLTRWLALAGWPGQKQVENDLGSWRPASPRGRGGPVQPGHDGHGATVCTRSKPACERCPVQADCQGLSQGNPTAYPHSKPKKSIPARNGIMLIIRHGDQLLLEKRPPQGIWGGLTASPGGIPSPR